MDDKPATMASLLKQALRDSKNLRENLKPLNKIIKRIGVCIAHKPVSWLQDFYKAQGLQDLQDIILDCKTKYSTLFNNNTGSQYYNSNHLSHTLNLNTSTFGSTNSLTSSSANAMGEFKDKDTLLTKEIRFECMKILKSFVNTSFGIKVVLESKSTIMAIATAIDYNDLQSMNVACLILAVLALLDHDKVLNGISEAAKFTGKHRFYSIVKGLSLSDEKETKVSPAD